MSRAILEVVPAELSFEEPWMVPPAAHHASLRRSTDGGPARLATHVAAFHDRKSLYVIFSGEDDEIVASYRDHDQPLYEEDVVEIFLAPTALTEYFELEVNPLGTTFDARIVWPNTERSRMRVDIGWECIGLWNAVRRQYIDHSRSRFEIVCAIPFAALDRDAPRDGESWRANFYRIDRAAVGDEYLAWEPTLRRPADFHVPSAFGQLIFRS